MRAGVDEQGQQVEIFAERAGPAVRQQQRQRRRPAALLVHQVDRLPAYHRPEMCELAQPRLERAGVELLPVGQQVGQPRPRDTLLPCGAATGG